jgi:hypothetical protein
MSPVHLLGHPEYTPEVVIDIDQLPPSMNDIIGQGSRWRYTAEKKKWGKLLSKPFSTPASAVAPACSPRAR